MKEYKVNLLKVKEYELIVEAESENAIEQMVLNNASELFDKAIDQTETYYGCHPWEIWRLEECSS